MWRAMLLLAAGGIALIIWGGREFVLGKDASAEPEPITIEDLEQGVPTNPYRKVGAHRAVLDHIVYSAKGKDENSTVEYAYYPIVSQRSWNDVKTKLKLEKDGPEEAQLMLPFLQIRALVKTRRWKNIGAIVAEANIDEQHNKTELVGTVVNKIDSLGTKETELLKKVTPSFDPGNTVIIEEGRKPKKGLAITLIIVGIALLLAPGVIWLVQRSRQKPEDRWDTPDDLDAQAPRDRP